MNNSNASSSEVCACCGTRRSVMTTYEACPNKGEGKEHEWVWCGDNYPQQNVPPRLPPAETLADELVNVPYQWRPLATGKVIVNDPDDYLRTVMESLREEREEKAAELLNSMFDKEPGDGPGVMVIDCLDDSRRVSDDPFGRPAEDEFGNRLTQDSAARKDMPMFDGLIDYFPDALAYVSKVSLEGAEKHCGGRLGWDRTKSTDHLNCAVRHLCDIRGRDPNSPRKLRHAGMLAWRALAHLQVTLENARMNGEDQ
jgi:hypothetical protein